MADARMNRYEVSLSAAAVYGRYAVREIPRGFLIVLNFGFYAGAVLFLRAAEEVKYVFFHLKQKGII